MLTIKIKKFFIKKKECEVDIFEKPMIKECSYDMIKKLRRDLKIKIEKFDST